MSRPDPTTLIQRLEREKSLGRLWRARELAQQYPGTVYDSELWRVCGQTLIDTHDLERAGRLLFFCGSRDPDHAAAIALYLDRTDANVIRRHTARLPSLDVLRPETRQALAERGIAKLPKTRAQPRSPTRLGDLVSIGFVLVLLALTAIGAFTVYRWLTG
jgi:hypothetical protein